MAADWQPFSSETPPITSSPAPRFTSARQCSAVYTDGLIDYRSYPEWVSALLRFSGWIEAVAERLCRRPVAAGLAVAGFCGLMAAPHSAVGVGVLVASLAALVAVGLLWLLNRDLRQLQGKA